MKSSKNTMRGRNTKYCEFCGNEKEAVHHLIFGVGRRNLAEEDGLVVEICHYCHNMGPITERIHDNMMAEKLSKMLGQALWEKKFLEEKREGNSREEFMKRYGINYL